VRVPNGGVRVVPDVTTRDDGVHELTGLEPVAAGVDAR